MKQRLYLTFGVLAAAGLLAGCSNQPSGNSGTTSSGASSDPTSSAAGGPSNGAPKVANPLDASKYIKDPCSSISAAQLKALTAEGLFAAPSPVRNDTEGQPACIWQGGGSLQVAWLVKYTNGINAIYSGKDMDAYWKPLTISGFPAVLEDITDDRSQGNCSLALGVSDKDVAYISFLSGPGLGSKSCTYAQDGAKALINTIRGTS